MKQNRNRQRMMTWTFFVCILIWGCPANQAPTDNQIAAVKEQPMEQASTALQLQPAMPLIDTQIPAQFDTATFGLG